MNILIVAPHPDDEVLGVGGTIRKLVNDGHKVTAAIATRGWPPLFPDEQVAQVRAEAEAAAKILGLSSLRYLDLPVTRLNELPRHEINAAFDKLINETTPEWVFLPHPGDRHEDHKQVFDACMVALRPTANRAFVKRTLLYETVSETHWSAPTVEPVFDPQVYINITDTLADKLTAMKKYTSQVHPSPDARSLEAVEALARWRGSVVGYQAAEAFTLIRDRID